jgi:hypothetical protein
MISPVAFPRLTDINYRVTSPASPQYNCVAWSAGDILHWWEPHVYWPTPVAPGENGIGVLDQAFRSLGYIECDDDSLEAGFEKVALYGSVLYWSHAARQLPTGKWTSKLGKMEDIEHNTPDDVTGGAYGEVVQLMKRPIQST